MLIIGLLIMVAAAVFAGVVLSENWGGPTYEIDGFGRVLGHLTLAQIFIAGIALMAVFVVGMWVASVSSRMRRRASGRRRAETRAVREEREALIADRDRLATELEEARRSRPIVLDDRPRVVSVADERAAYRGDEYPNREVYAGREYADRDVFGQPAVDPSNIDGQYADPGVSPEVRQHTV
jgi:uncharacterized membrane protein